MCYSATASFAAATLLTGIGSVTLKNTEKKSLLPLALTPLLFAVQQAAEGIVWLTINSPEYTMLKNIGTYTFLFFAMILWPVWSSGVLNYAEKKSNRKKVMKIFFITGLTYSLSALYYMLLYPVTADVVSCHILYDSAASLPFSDLFYLMWYTTATVIPFFISSLMYVWTFGLAAIIALLVTYLFMKTTLISVWCFFAALLSMLVLLIIKTNNA